MSTANVPTASSPARAPRLIAVDSAFWDALDAANNAARAAQVLALLDDWRRRAPSAGCTGSATAGFAASPAASVAPTDIDVSMVDVNEDATSAATSPAASPAAPVAPTDIDVSMVDVNEDAAGDAAAEDLHADAVRHRFHRRQGGLAPSIYAGLTAALLSDQPSICLPKARRSQLVQRILSYSGLGAIPQWGQPYESLSTGQRARARAAMALALFARLPQGQIGPGPKVAFSLGDETLDRATAEATARCFGKGFRKLRSARSKTPQPDVIVALHDLDHLVRYMQPSMAVNFRGEVHINADPEKHFPTPDIQFAAGQELHLTTEKTKASDQKAYEQTASFRDAFPKMPTWLVRYAGEQRQNMREMQAERRSIKAEAAGAEMKTTKKKKKKTTTTTKTRAAVSALPLMPPPPPPPSHILTLKVKAAQSKATEECLAKFGCSWTDQITTKDIIVPVIPGGARLVVLLGPSGTGKTSVLRYLSEAFVGPNIEMPGCVEDLLATADGHPSLRHQLLAAIGGDRIRLETPCSQLNPSDAELVRISTAVDYDENVGFDEFLSFQKSDSRAQKGKAFAKFMLPRLAITSGRRTIFVTTLDENIAESMASAGDAVVVWHTLRREFVTYEKSSSATAPSSSPSSPSSSSLSSSSPGSLGSSSSAFVVSGGGKSSATAASSSIAISHFEAPPPQPLLIAACSPHWWWRFAE
jgi:ABC-type hemin transport system ATPase subunit